MCQGAETAACSDYGVVLGNMSHAVRAPVPTTANRMPSRVHVLPPGWSRAHSHEVDNELERCVRDTDPTRDNMHSFDSLAQELAIVAPTLPRRPPLTADSRWASLGVCVCVPKECCRVCDHPGGKFSKDQQAQGMQPRAALGETTSPPRR